MHQTCQCLLYQPILQIFGSSSGSSPDFDGMGHRSTYAQLKELREMLGPLVREFTDFENHVTTIRNAVGLLTSRITTVEQIVSVFSAKMVAFTGMDQNFSTLTAHMCKVETFAPLNFKCFWFGKVVGTGQEHKTEARFILKST